MNDKQMTRQTAIALITSEGIEARLPGTPAFGVSSNAEEDIREGMIARIAKMLEPPLEMLFLEHMNELDVLDDYLDDPDSQSSDMQRDKFAEYITGNGCEALRERLPSLTGRIRSIAKAYSDAISEMLVRLDESYDSVCDTLLGGRRFRTITEESERGE